VSQYRILIIDDEVDFTLLVKDTLELLDSAYKVEIANSGKEGLKKPKK